MTAQKFRSAPKGPPSVTSGIANGGASFFGKLPQNVLSTPGNPFVEIDLPIPETLTPSQVEEVVLLRDLINEAKHSIYYLTDKKVKKDIERYSDKYLDESQGTSVSKIHAIVTDISLFPEELHSVYRPEKAQKVKKQIAPSRFNILKFEHFQRMEEAEQQLQQTQQLEDEKELEEVQEDYDEDEFEDETDYNNSYFDPGDNYGDYDDDAGGGGGGDYEPTF